MSYILQRRLILIKDVISTRSSLSEESSDDDDFFQIDATQQYSALSRENFSEVTGKWFLTN